MFLEYTKDVFVPWVSMYLEQGALQLNLKGNKRIVAE